VYEAVHTSWTSVIQKGKNIMKLITDKLIQRFKEQGDTAEMKAENITVIAKFFCPWGAATWFATDYYPEENLCFGYANLGDDSSAELGYFSIEELESLRGPLGLRVERDLYWSPKTLKEVVELKGHL